MAKQKIICEFDPVNGNRTGVFARTGQAKGFPSKGVLYMRNCPDGKTFVVEADGGKNGFHRLLHPSYYGLPNTTLYVWIDDSYIKRRTYTFEDVPRKGGSYTPPQNSGITSPPSGKRVESIDDYKPPATEYDAGSSGSLNYESSGDRVWHKGTLTEQHVPGTGLEREISGGAILFDRPNKYSYGSIVRNSFLNDYSYAAKAIDIIERNLNLALGAPTLSAIKHDMQTKFNRYRMNYPDLQLARTVQYIFFTRPDLNILRSQGGMDYQLTDETSREPEFYYLHKNKPMVLLSLTRHLSAYHDFNPYLSNTAKSFQLKDEVLETAEHGETYTGHKIKYARHMNKSKVGGEFSIEFVEDSDFTVYKTIAAWTKYMDMVYRGQLTPGTDMIRNKILDYPVSVYFFTCGVDGSTILFWSKYTGVFPTNTPSSSLSYNEGSDIRMPKYSINFEYAWKEDFSVLSLGEFNANSRGDYRYVSSYEPKLLTGGKAFVGAPFVETLRNSVGDYEFKLRFRSLQ